MNHSRTPCDFFPVQNCGDERSIPLLEPYLKPGEEKTDERARLADEAITAIRTRLTRERERDERARAELDLPPPMPMAPNVLAAVRSRAFAHESLWDSSAAREKYTRNWIQITGRIDSMAYVLNKPYLWLETDNFVVSVQPKDPYAFCGLTPGQTVTLKCGVDWLSSLLDAEVLQVDGPPPIKATVSQLAARYSDPVKAQENLKKDKGRWVQTQGTICKLEEDNYFILLETGIDIKVMVTCKAFRVEERDELQVGDELSVLGMIDDFRADYDPPRVIVLDCLLCAEPRVLKKEPEPAAEAESP
jgi:hypothetical protein